ncbi:Sec-independent protein translocase subunit TatA [Rothia nasimurium]|uniref:Sec-independent protein translocase subunit TatA n=1 Tax=Rothia nasimurium TaxID=85336 RepID=UPI001FD4DEBA|nr:Sec-independent protein translocase subunit TatA [Rothia nasimurium]
MTLVLGNLGPVHLIILLIIIILLFGAPKLPGMARSLGQSMRIFKSEVDGLKNDSKKNNEANGDTNGSVVSGEVINNPTTTDQNKGSQN